MRRASKEPAIGETVGWPRKLFDERESEVVERRSSVIDLGL
jgi:hypothetical protein